MINNIESTQFEDPSPVPPKSDIKYFDDHPGSSIWPILDLDTSIQDIRGCATLSSRNKKPLPLMHDEEKIKKKIEATRRIVNELGLTILQNLSKESFESWWKNSKSIYVFDGKHLEDLKRKIDP